MTPLHYIGDHLRALMAQIPLSLARAAFVALLLAVLVWVVTLPRQDTRPESGGAGWTENLKVWAVFALLIQVAIYLLL